MSHFEKTREREKQYHDELYSQHELFTPGSWLYRPVPFVLKSFEYIQNKENPNTLDLGCGVGRHSIPLAQFLGEDGKVFGVDLLDSAINGLKVNAKRFSVEKKIIPILSDIEEYPLGDVYFDYIVSVSSIEHVKTRESFVEILKNLQRVTNSKGVHCFCIISDNVWIDEKTGAKMEPLIEINLSSEEVKNILNELYSNWDIKELSQKVWRTKEKVDGEDVLFQNTCVQFLAIK